METDRGAAIDCRDREKGEGKERLIISDIEEAELIGRIQAGEKDQFAQLVARYNNLVFALIRRQVGSDALAEEIAQEVFVRAYFSIKKFRGAASFSTWLTRIALNQTSSYFSSKKFKAERLSESFDTNRHELSDDEDRNMNELEERHANRMRKFQTALATLKPAFREVLSLCALEEKSYQEAAEILEIPVGTIRSRLNKARLLLATAMKRQEA